MPTPFKRLTPSPKTRTPPTTTKINCNCEIKLVDVTSAT